MGGFVESPPNPADETDHQQHRSDRGGAANDVLPSRTLAGIVGIQRLHEGSIEPPVRRVGG
jgi:hypothetical protein